jgi:hypothetical protein
LFRLNCHVARPLKRKAGVAEEYRNEHGAGVPGIARPPTRGRGTG